MSHETIVLIVAVISTIIGVGAFFHLFLMVNGWPRATGRVVGNEASRSTHDHSNRYAYFPRVAFVTADGGAYEVKGDIGRTTEWPIGQTVEVRYRRSNPSHASIMKGWQRLLFASFFIACGVVSWGVWLGYWR